MMPKLMISLVYLSLIGFAACSVDDSIEENSSSLTSNCQLTNIASVYASTDDGNVPSNVLDGKLSTRWSGFGMGASITADLGAPVSVCAVGIAWYDGRSRTNNFIISTSLDGSTFKTAYTGTSSGRKTSIENYSFTVEKARYVRVTVNGNSQNLWASITELRVYASPETAPTPTPKPTPTPPPTNGSNDSFGIKMLHSTTAGGREWFNKWGAAGTVDKSYDSDTPNDYYDSNLHYLSSGNFLVYGANGAYPGQMMVTGLEPRIYVRDSANAPVKTWKNVETTLYARLISADTTTPEYDWASIDTSIRGDHWDYTQDCGTAAYYGRMLFKGYMDFEKEISHNAGSYKRTDAEPNGYNNYWPGGMPLNTWIGYKFVARNSSAGTKVQLELYLDTTDGANGGTWTQMISFEDYPGWSGGMATDCPSRDPGAVLTNANYSVMVRPDALDKAGNAIYFKKFSVREIDPLP